jgi:general secretion pathway protein N
VNAAGQRRLTPVLGGIAAVFALLLLLLLAGIGRGVQWGPPRPATPLPQAREQGLPTPAPLEQFAVVWTQPLFNPDRKPTLRTASGGASLGDMQLTGIILTSTLHMALLHDKSGDHEVRVREGDTLPDGSWRLAELKPRAAVFESSSGRTQLDLPAGAPIDMPKTSPNAPTPPNTAANGAPVLPPGAMMVGAPPPQSMPMPVSPPPPQASEIHDAQADRIRQLKEAIQKRRAEQQQDASTQGAH